MRKKCPKCKSTDIKIEKYLGADCIICMNCGYDERDTYEEFAQERASQKAKGRYSPYKAGGKGRIRTSK